MPRRGTQRKGRHSRSSRSRAAGLRLHLRARGALAFAVGVLAVATTGWFAADWLVHREWLGGADARIPIIAAAPLLAAVLSATSLGGADEDLERTTAVPWRVVRTVHVLVIAAIIGFALALIGLWEPHIYGAFELVRNVLGYLGMITAAAVVLGARLAWAPAFGYAAVVYLAAPKPLGSGTAWWTWPLQPWGTHAAAWVAGGIFVVGLALYSWFGARVERHADVP